MSSDSCGIRLK